MRMSISMVSLALGGHPRWGQSVTDGVSAFYDEDEDEGRCCRQNQGTLKPVPCVSLSHLPG